MENKLVVGERVGVTVRETRGSVCSDGAVLYLDGSSASRQLHLLQPGKKLYTHLVPRPVSWF